MIFVSFSLTEKCCMMLILIIIMMKQMTKNITDTHMIF